MIMDTIFPKADSMRHIADGKKMILKEVYRFIQEETTQEPHPQLIEYFLPLNIQYDTLQDRGILYLDEKTLQDLKRFMIEEYDRYVPLDEISLDDFISIGLKSEFAQKNDIDASTFENAFIQLTQHKTIDETEASLGRLIQRIFYLQQHSFLNSDQEMLFDSPQIIFPFFRKSIGNEVGKQIEGLYFCSSDQKTLEESTFQSYGNVRFYNQDILEGHTTLILCQSVIDTLTTLDLRYASISISAADIQFSTDELNLFFGKRIYVMANNDQSGEIFIENLSKALGAIVANPTVDGKLKALPLPSDNVSNLHTWHAQSNKDGNINPFDEHLDHSVSNYAKTKIEFQTPFFKYKVALCINSSLEKNTMGKFGDITDYLISTGTQVFSISDRSMINFNKYYDYGKSNKIKFIPNLKVKLAGLYDINLMFRNRESLIHTLKSIQNGEISLQQLNDIHEDVTIIFPLSMNTLLLKHNPIRSTNVLIGVESNIDLDFLPTDFAFTPIFVNNNSFVSPADFYSYNLFSNIHNNQKTDWVQINEPINIHDKTKYIRNSYFLNFGLPFYSAEKRKNDEAELKKIFEEIVFNTVSFGEEFSLQEI